MGLGVMGSQSAFSDLDSSNLDSSSPWLWRNFEDFKDEWNKKAYALRYAPDALKRFEKDISLKTKEIIRAHKSLVEVSNSGDLTEKNAEKVKKAFSNLAKYIWEFRKEDKEKKFLETIVNNKGELCQNFFNPKQNLKADYCERLITEALGGVKNTTFSTKSFFNSSQNFKK
ncbi:hypothetical protein [Holospora undulata]|uniref:hypothetical protein n=1 Tax=Holospora undulata TaxID=1169117 RepID=UPI0012693E1F|nr:hypothetical protein [Holospora undulata]